MKEFVLPSGRFAVLRPIKWGDIVAGLARPSNMMVTTLLTRCVTLDGKAITEEEWLDQDLDEVNPITSIMMAEIEKALGHKKGIA